MIAETEVAINNINENKNRIKRGIIPLVIRGAETEEILKISEGLEGLSKKIVESILEEIRINLFTSTTSIRIVRMRKGKSTDGISPQNPLDDGQKKIAFAGKIFQAGLIPSNNSCFSELIDSCREKINLDNFYDALRLEMFYGAVTLDNLGDKTRLDIYNCIGREVDPEWFAESLKKEEEVIKEGLGMIGISKAQVPVTVRDGLVIIDTAGSYIARLKKRWGMGEENNQGNGGKSKTRVRRKRVGL